MTWYYWLILGILLCSAEIFVPGFVILWFGVSGIVVSLFSLLGLNPVIQWILFIILSLLLIFSTRRFAEKITGKTKEQVGPESLIGKEAVVIEEIDPKEGKYLVKVNGSEWVGKVNSKKPISGEILHVKDVKGNALLLD